MSRRTQDENRAIVARARREGYPNVGPNPSPVTMRILRRFLAEVDANNRRSIYYVVHRTLGNFTSGEIEFVIRRRRQAGGISVDQLRSGTSALTQLFNGMINYVKWIRDLRDTDRMLFRLHDPSPNNPQHYSTGMIQSRTLNARRVMNTIMDKLNSNQQFDLFAARYVIVWARRTRLGGYMESITDFERFAKEKRSIVRISGEYNNCMLQCITLHRAWLYNKTLYTKLVKKPKMLQRHTQEMFPERSLITLDELPNLEKEIGFGIRVVEWLSRRVIFRPDILLTEEQDMTVICHSDSGIGHVHYVKFDRLGALWARNSYCRKCEKAIRKYSHTCEKYCPRCRSDECIGRDFTNRHEWTFMCFVCNFMFASEQCLERHVERGYCKKQKKCTACYAIYNPKKTHHICGERICDTCGDLISTLHYPIVRHKCYQQPIDLKKIAEPKDLYVYYDYECYFDSNMRHIPYYICAMYSTSDEVFEFRTTSDFLNWALDSSHKKYTFIAHNGGRYDSHFIKQELLKRRIESDDLMRGNTYLQIYITRMKIRFIDSYKFIPTSLRRFPATFGLKDVTKGYFPYRFLTEETMNYVGPIPDIEYFDFHHLKPKERKVAEEWYAEQDIIDIYEMCRTYCIDDVRVLKEGCNTFRRNILQVSQNLVDPFACITIAATAMKIFRTLFLKKHTIGILQLEGLQRNLEARQLFVNDLWKQGYDIGATLPTMKENISHKVTAADYAMQKVVMLQECLWHGCSDCFKRFTINPYNQQSMTELQYSFQLMLSDLKEVGWEIEVKKECQIAKYYVERKITLPIEQKVMTIHDTFFGGRTEYFEMYRKACDGEKIRYYDYTSLYPSVLYGVLWGITEGTKNFTRKLYYPIGHPTRITSNFKPLQEYFGFIKCAIIPPKDMRIPLLPERCNGKLQFNLKPKIGCWTTVEVEKAVQVGYEITHVYEILHFEEKSNDLFQGYIREFLKLKIRATGWEKLGLNTEVERYQYLYEIQQRFGISLRYDEMGEYNAGMYAISKLFLNSLWGKFAQRAVKRNCQDVFDPKVFEEIVFDDCHEVTDVYCHGKDVRTVVTEKRADFVNDPKTTNIALASYTTAYGRLRLFEAMELVMPQMLYCDTDSIVCVDDGNLPVRTGRFLGDLTDELGESGDVWITEFVSTGPKSYAFRTSEGNEVIHVKGISLAYDSDGTICFDSMKAMCLDPTQTVEVEQLNFVIGKDHEIHTKTTNTHKVFRVTGDKRKREACEYHDGKLKRINTKSFI